MRQRLSFGLIATGAIALLLIAIASFYWLFPKGTPSLVGGKGTEPGAAIFVSKQAPAMVSLLVNSETLSGLFPDGQLSQFKTSLFAQSSINYQKDIQPWLGKEVTLAVTTPDIDRNPETGLQPGYLMVLATTEPEKSREFVDLFFSRRVLAGSQLVVEKYKGVKLIYDILPEKPESQTISQSIASATVGDSFVLFANHPKILREAINNVQAPDLNLITCSQYQQAIKQLPQGTLGLTFLNLPSVAQWQGLKLSQPIYNRQMIALAVSGKELLAETIIAAAANKTLPPLQLLSQPPEALKYIPSSAGVVIAGSNLSGLGDSALGQFWTQTTAISGSSQDMMGQWVKPLQDANKGWGINWREDIFNWVQGEYAIGLLPQGKHQTPNWIFVVEKSDAETGISRLNAIASKEGLSINTLNLDDTKLSAWTELTTVAKDQKSFNIEAKIKGLHTTLGDYEIFASSLETMDAVIKAGEDSLINNPNFQNSIAAFPTPNQGYVYIDWINSQDILEQELPLIKFLQILGNPFFQKLRSLTFSSYGSTTEFLKGGVNFQLQD
ncbi:MAG: DUF3352 domain-containing protein [Nostocaceae cyanobacterium]|nr:DUF3352 domain-containing protein [Nostocaceae cyanobacterium]